MCLRHHAMRFIGKPIIAHHKNGTVHHGILHAVTDDGIYIRPHRMRYVAGEKQEQVIERADATNLDAVDADLVFGFGAGFGAGFGVGFGGFGIGAGFGAGIGFIPWGGLGGFWGGGLWF